MTTIHMFKNHRNKKNIRFIILPIAHEILRSTSDIPMNINDLMKMYGANGSEETYGIELDWSLILTNGNPELWVLNTITDLQRRKSMRLPSKICPDRLRDTKVSQGRPRTLYGGEG